MLLEGLLLSLLISTVVVCFLLACFRHCVLTPRWLKGRDTALRATQTWYDFADVVPRLKSPVDEGNRALFAGKGGESGP